MQNLIVCLKGSSESTGKTIEFNDNASLDTVRQLAAVALHILVNDPQNLLLYNSLNRLLGGLEDLKKEQIVFVDLPCHLRTGIPGPRKLPLVGNLYDLLPNLDVGWMKQFETYGPLVDMTVVGTRTIGTNDTDIADQFLKENEYFTKKIAPTSLREVQKFAGDGLFTSDTDSKHWALAHKLLMPAFSPRAIKDYQGEMGEITMQAISIFDQFKPGEEIDILDWTTKITFETIGRIGFGYEFGLLDSKDSPQDPLIEAMGTLLHLTLARTKQMEFMQHFPTANNRKFDECVQLMHKKVLDVVIERKSGPDAKDAKKDLLGYMLNACDENGEYMSDENIRDQVVTFMIAGHDTTANTLAWFFYELARNPDVQAKVLQEIANVGITHDKLPTTEQVNGLKYMMQVIKETLRMYPPVRKLNKFCRQDCILPYGFKIPGGTAVAINVYSLHHNEKVYPSSFTFDPDRFDPDEEQKRPASAWLPFSTGPRACIGRPFALQEAKTVASMILHKFDLRYDGPAIEFDATSSTTKPLNLVMSVHDRTNFPEPTADTSLPKTDKTKKLAAAMPHPHLDPATMDADKQARLPTITFLYGTQTGTAQDFANQLFNQAKEFGFTARFMEMDKWDGYKGSKYSAPGKQEMIVVCTATYNGLPPDSAEKFSKFLDVKLCEPGHEKYFEGLLYAVFGVGNKNWHTYQKFPTKVDDTLEQMGATRVFTRGEGDADEDMDYDFNVWSSRFWMSILGAYGLVASADKSVVPVEATSKTISNVKVNYFSPSDLQYQEGANNNNLSKYGKAYVQVNRELQQKDSGRSTRHIELDIRNLTPVVNAKDGQPFITGDHLEVFPQNSQTLAEAIGLNFGWVLDSVFEVEEESKRNVSSRTLAAVIEGPCTIRNALTYYADLTGPPSRLFLRAFAQQLRKATDDVTVDAVVKQFTPDVDANDPYPAFIKAHRTMLDVQAAFPQVKDFDFGQFLASVTAIQPRRYSISSSPLVNSEACTLTVGVVDDVANGKHYPGLSSSYLSQCLTSNSGSAMVRALFKSAKSSFSLPTDPEVPIIMIAAGTGVSPFRGFMEERAVLKRQGKNVGDNVLFFGCRRQDQDFIYKEEWTKYKVQGVLTSLHVAFSREVPPSPSKYVQHQILLQANQVWTMMNPRDTSIKPAVVYICGAGSMSRDVRKAFLNMTKSFGAADSDESAEIFFQQWVDDGRYNEDVWG
ncbi:cytochrome P450 [Hesseltinella vesiculosa]|uniref:NADPH--hemoprotein reductase n=1 Tax=Hesseltinella vesiculosa TaxID=101127 RepID=A0A1X2GTF3_9FUNG|nr:cytochrome P450 [Hesseltinella vesiculosa]